MNYAMRLKGKKLEAAIVRSVYSGVAGACMCGCKGKHRYASAYRDQSSKARGYVVSDDEVSDRSITMIVNKINANLQDAEYDADYVAVDVGNRTYVAYLAS